MASMAAPTDASVRRSPLAFHEKEVEGVYKAVIMDDDRWALTDIRQTFDFENHGFQVVGAYGSVEEGLPAILALQPDLIVSDIRMAQKSGLDMARICRENGLSTQIILVSGYESFHYAQEAMRHGVFAYLLKPLQDLEVQDAMDRVTQKIEGLQEEESPVFTDDSLGRAMSYITEHYMDSLPL